MTAMSPYLILIFVTLAAAVHGNEKAAHPPHCTQLTKDTDYKSNFKFDYPPVYIVPGQREAFQPLHCVNPPTVNKAVTVVCDWAAPPEVTFTPGDAYAHIVRQDPSGRYAGNAVITTYQLCNHNIPPRVENEIEQPIVSEVNA